jgi:hypothetical protein
MKRVSTGAVVLIMAVVPLLLVIVPAVLGFACGRLGWC